MALAGVGSRGGRVTHNEKVLTLLPHQDECILWTAYVAADGYGRVNRGDRHRAPQVAHRYVYEQELGSIPRGYEIHHGCKNRACVNIDHLQLVTRLEHRALERAERTHCKRGHPYSEHGRNHKGRAAIYCTQCRRETDNRRRACA